MIAPNLRHHALYQTAAVSQSGKHHLRIILRGVYITLLNPVLKQLNSVLGETPGS